MHAGSRYNGFGSPRIHPERVDLTLVVPAYNEADRLEDGLDRLATILASGAADPTTTEVLVVDDGSSDETATRAEKLIVRFPRGRVIRLRSNAGKGAAVRGGVAAAAGPRVAFMDADMSIDPSQLPALLAALNTAPVAIGSRASSTGAVDYDNLLRTALGRGFNRLVNAVTNVGLADTQCGFKAFRTPVARLLFHLTVIDHFAFDVEVLFRARRLGLEITEVPVQWRHVAESRVRPLHDPLTMLGDVLRSRLGLPRPLPVQAVRLHPGRPGADLAGRARAIVGPLLPLVEGSGGTLLVLFALTRPADVAVAAAALSSCPDVRRIERLGVTSSDLERLAPVGVLDDGHPRTAAGDGPDLGAIGAAASDRGRETREIA